MTKYEIIDILFHAIGPLAGGFMPYGLARLSKDLLLVAIGLLLFIRNHPKKLIDISKAASYNEHMFYKGGLFMNSINNKGFIKILKEGFFYGVLGNDALILNKYFGYKLYKANDIKTGFPVKKLDTIIEKLDILSMDYKVFNRNKIIIEKSFEENLYEIIDEDLSYLETSKSNRNHDKFFGKPKRPNKKECIAILESLTQEIDFYTGECIVGLSEASKEQLQLLVNFLNPTQKDPSIEQNTPPKEENPVEIVNVQKPLEQEPITDETEITLEEEPLFGNEELLENTSSIEEKPLTCKNCLEYKKSECFGKPQPCDDFRYSPDMDEEKRKNWPKYGDATFFRMHGHKRG